MPFYPRRRALPQRFRLILSSFLHHDGLPFADVLPEQAIHQAFADADVDFAQADQDIYTPALTLWAFLSQVLHAREMRPARPPSRGSSCCWSRWGKGRARTIPARIAGRVPKCRSQPFGV